MKRASISTIVRALGPATLLALAVGSGCSSTPPPVSSHDLERPTDISFVCLRGIPPVVDAGADGGADASADGGADASSPLSPLRVSGRPMSECHPPLQFDPIPVDITHRTFGFVTNTSRGELAVIDMDASLLVDLDATIPGINLVPLGVLPEQMSASDDGCRLITANRGSCDLTMVDPSVVLTPKLTAEAKLNLLTPDARTPSIYATESAQTIVVHGPSGPLHVAPQEVLFLRQNTAAMTGEQNLCPLGFDPTGPAPWQALVTYPTCGLVALINLPSGEIVDSMSITSDGQGGVQLTSAGADPSCPIFDCTPAGGGGGGVAPDGGASGPASGTLPGSLALLPDGSRAYVSLGNAPYVAAFDVSSTGLGNGASIALHDNDNGGALGSDRVRLSVDPYQKTGTPGLFGRFVGEGTDRTRQYLYVFAHDGTVRVINVSPAARHQPETECETNLDPLDIPADMRAAMTCPPVTNPPVGRRPAATGPGISVAGVPVDATFVDLTVQDAFSDREQVLDGSYGFILTTSGATFIVNIDPTLRTQTLVNSVVEAAMPPEVQPLVNSLRDHNQVSFITTLDPSSGPPRLDITPVPPAAGPQIEGILVQDPADNATIISGTTPGTTVTPLPVATYVFFPERTDVAAQTWTLTWEGNVFGPSFSGQIQAQPGTGPAAFTDLGTDFCQAGALDHDIVNLVGCTVDAQCGPLQVCRTSVSAPPTTLSLPINGICVSADATTQTEQVNNFSCTDLQGSVKRYEIVSATPGGLTIVPKIDEVSTTLLAPCDPTKADPDEDCHFADDPSRMLFKCRSDGRCVQPCDLRNPAMPNSYSNPCRTGRVCADFDPVDATLGTSFCADAPNVTSALINGCGLSQLIGYQLQAGNSFVVQGSAGSPAVPRGVTPDGSTCAEGGRNPLLVDRIPLTKATIPACTNPVITGLAKGHPDGQLAAAGALGNPEQLLFLEIAHTTPTPNPCIFTGGPVATDPPTSVTDPPPPPPTHMRVLFQNNQLRFLLASVEQYTSDIAQIQFTVHGGFLPDSVFVPGDIDINMAARIVVSPLDSQAQLFDMSMTHEIPYLFVVDQRRLGNPSAGVGATRGQVLRIHPREPNSTDIADSSALFPIYQDPSATAGLWPIQ